MDQAIVRTIIAPAKLIWKNQLGKDLLSVYEVDRAKTARRGAVTVVVTMTGDLEGRVLYVLNEEAAKGVEAGFNPRWTDGLTKETLDAVGKIMKAVATNVPKLFESMGLTCTAQVTGVLDTKGKGVANADKWPGVAVLEMEAPLDEDSEKEEIAVWVDVKQSDESALLGEIKSDLESMSRKGPYSGDLSGLTAAEAARERARSGAIAANITELDSSGGANGKEHEVRVVPEVKAGIVTVEKLEIVNADARTRTVLGTLGDGSPYMALADEHGRIRATFKLDPEGDASLSFADDVGAETWMAPAELPQPMVQRPPARPAPPPPGGRPPRRPPPGMQPRGRPRPRPRPGQRPAVARGRPAPRAPRR